MEQMELSELLNYITADMKEYMSEHSSVSSVIARICMCVEKNPALSQENVAKKLSMDKSMLAKNVRKAQQEGYLRREVSPIDSRKTELYITEKGRQMNKETEKLSVEWENKAFSRLNESEKRQLSYLLNAIYRSSAKK